VEVDVRVSSRPLTEKEREKLTVYLHKGATGDFDFDILANEFELDDLLEWGFEPFEFGLSDEDGIVDGVFSEDASIEDTGLADTMMVIGEYRQVIPRDTYLNWLESVRQIHGFDKQAISSELWRRVGLDKY